MWTRKHRVAGVLVAVLVLTAGCSALLGEGPLEFSAEKATVADATVSETGYEKLTERTVRINRTIELQNESRDLRITSHVAAYDKEYGDAGPGYFLLLSTPKAEVLNQSLNPLGALDTETLVDRALARVRASDRVNINDSEIETVGTENRTVLGKQATVTTFDATASRSGETADVFVKATRVAHGDDFVIAVAVYPKNASAGGEEIGAMLDGIEHNSSDSEES